MVQHLMMIRIIPARIGQVAVKEVPKWAIMTELGVVPGQHHGILHMDPEDVVNQTFRVLEEMAIFTVLQVIENWIKNMSRFKW